MNIKPTWIRFNNKDNVFIKKEAIIGFRVELLEILGKIEYLIHLYTTGSNIILDYNKDKESYETDLNLLKGD